MPFTEIDQLIGQLMPQVLQDRDLGDGRTFTRLHFTRLWALSCLQAGVCLDEYLLTDSIARHLPAKVLLAHELERSVAAG
ncbi:MAG: hypothetical protein H7Y32_11685 [Chloroflexales bacterium]|nr:hypothetical protein [Chloroflexales bacterium]